MTARRYVVPLPNAEYTLSAAALDARPAHRRQPRLLDSGQFLIVGEELNSELDKQFPERSTPIRVQSPGQKKSMPLTRIGTMTADGPAAALGGNIVVTAMNTASAILGRKQGMV